MKGWRALADNVKHFKAHGLYGGKEVRLEVTITPNQDKADPEIIPPRLLWDKILLPKVMQLKGYKPMEGMAPAGDLERKVQEWIDSASKD